MFSSNLILTALAAVFIFWTVGAYNRLVRLKNVIINAFGLVDVQLRRRCDLIPPLVDAAKKYLQHEHAALEVVRQALHRACTASDMARSRPASAQALLNLSAAEQTLEGGLGRLFAVAEACPDLKADQTIRELTEELKSVENKVAFARQAFNDAVLDYNKARGQFPVLMLARAFGFVPSAMLHATQTPLELQAIRAER